MQSSVPSSSRLAVASDSSIVEKDLLNFKRYKEPLVELITNPETETPFTIGIFGKWGTGKTTLLQMIETQLKSAEYPYVWFNPWLYQTENNLIVPLLHTINDSLSSSKIEGFKESATRVATVAAEVSVGLGLKAMTLGQASLKDIDEREKLYNQRNYKAVSAIRKLRNELQKVVDNLTDHGKKRLVIYIDDLDRCVPTNVINLLEAVKLFLDLKHVIIFLAIDKDVVQQGIQVFYKDFNFSEEEYARVAADYMDKMIQLPFYLNPLSPEQIGDYLQQLPPASTLADDIKLLFQKCLEPNPRKIKRVLNIYALNAAILDRDSSLQLKKSVLAKLIIIQQQWNSLYRDAIVNSEILHYLEKVYSKQLSLTDKNQWAGNELLRDKCEHYYKQPPQISALLAELFKQGESFENVDLRKYLFMLS